MLVPAMRRISPLPASILLKEDEHIASRNVSSYHEKDEPANRASSPAMDEHIACRNVGSYHAKDEPANHVSSPAIRRMIP